MKNGVVETRTTETAASGELLKLQVAFSSEMPQELLQADNIQILEHVGRVYTILVSRQEHDAIMERLKQAEALFIEPLPVKLEDLYVWKLGGHEHVG